MAIVSACAYDSRGQLVRPDTFDISRAKIRLDLDTGERATFDSGHTYVFVVSDMGVTAEQAHKRVNLRLLRFFDRAEAERGFRRIVTKRRQSRARAERPESSLPTGMLSGLSVFTFQCNIDHLLPTVTVSRITRNGRRVPVQCHSVSSREP